MDAIFIVLFVLLPLYDALPTTKKVGCQIGGKIYPEGASFSPSPCKHCYCSQGREVCAIADCFFTMCVDSVHKPGVCCPVCPNGANCYVGHQIIPAGQDVKIGEHMTCRCPEAGHMFGSGGNQAACSMSLQTVKPLPKVLV